MIKVKKANSNEKLELLATFNQAMGSNIPDAYALQSDVWIFVDHDEIVAGFSINTSSLRAFSFLPAAQQIELRGKYQADKKAVESNLTWIKKEKRGSAFSVFFWFFLLAKVFLTFRPYYIIAWNPENKRLSKRYQRLVREPIYLGPNASAESTEKIAVGVSSSMRCLLSPFLYWQNIFAFLGGRKAILQLRLLKLQESSYSISNHGIRNPLKTSYISSFNVVHLFGVLLAAAVSHTVIVDIFHNSLKLTL
ncbi:hypothetical protein SAMN06296036_12425 [Pseudobacteriovorax antillogorgiicola]|uniref:Uncharacterized protein n=1 Tax=Pseudobacteriovorax antillogorgiicola TaxID=1513793 RepID=A0A1Y6CRP1_9BACT|nr:hypothetical protein EDD56_12425 [Pseudobacteriovorax antillogorgiicola]SMF68431.1 hypothetical protein SAMN06296036_12425 [Pseudobacteriovorax antillogorgiicola]